MIFKIKVSELMPGMVLAENVNCGDKMLIESGTVIRQSLIKQFSLGNAGKISVYPGIYEDELFFNPVKKSYENAYNDIGSILNGLKKGKQIDISKIVSITKGLLDLVLGNQNYILLLTGYRSNFDIYYHAHSIDVCIYSLILAKVMGLQYDEALNLGIGALLHDIGKTKVPISILNKPGRLTSAEFNEVKKHPLYGYDILKDISEINPLVKRIVLEHHERLDGSGYPYNLKDDALCKLSKIVAIADVYDALTSDRVYRNRVLPHKAAEYLTNMSSGLLDSEITDIFKKNIAIYPQGCYVLLNSNQIATVIDSNTEAPQRPLLKVITDCKGNALESPYKMDFSQKDNVFITQIIR